MIKLIFCPKILQIRQVNFLFKFSPAKVAIAHVDKLQNVAFLSCKHTREKYLPRATISRKES